MAKTLLIVFVITICCSLSNYAQRSISNCESIAQEKINAKSDFSITYLRSGKRKSPFVGESSDRIWLRLFNDSKKTLQVYGYSFTETQKLLKNRGNELNIFYEVVEKECDDGNEKETKVYLSGSKLERDVLLNLKPKASIIFSVPKEHLLSKRAIYIPYQCIKNCSTDTKQPNELQKAVFFAFELPNQNNLSKLNY